MLNTVVKVSHITNLSDARYCAGMGAEMLGFCVDEESENYVPLKKFQEIRSWVVGVQIVAETTETVAEKIIELCRTYQPDMLQLTDSKALAWLKSELDLPIILRIEADQDADDIEIAMQQNLPYIKYFLIESASNTPWQKDWEVFLANVSHKYPILIGLDFSVEEATNLVATNGRVGIALQGSDEIRPGYKEFGELMEVLEALQEMS